MDRQQQEALAVAFGWAIVTRADPRTKAELEPLWFAPWSTTLRELPAPDSAAWALDLERLFVSLGYDMVIGQRGDRFEISLESVGREIPNIPANAGPKVVGRPALVGLPVVADSIVEALNGLLLVVHEVRT